MGLGSKLSPEELIIVLFAVAIYFAGSIGVPSPESKFRIKRVKLRSDHKEPIIT